MNTAEFAELLSSYVGKRYVWGANGPDIVDCSGMVYSVYNRSGNVRSDTTAQGLYNRTTPVSNPRLGDLAFLHSGGRITHVGIIVDPDTVIEARGHAYGVVRTKLSTFRNRSGYTWKGVRRDMSFHLDQTQPPVPVTNAARRFNVGFAAQQNHRFGGLESSSMVRTAKLRSTLNLSVFGVTECDSVMEAAILHAFPDHNSVKLSTGTVVVFYKRSVWTVRASRQVLHGDGYHGALCVPLVDKVNGEGFDFIVNHTRPKSVTTSAGKVADIERAKSLAGTWPVIFAGDWAMNADNILRGVTYPRITPDMDTYDLPGDDRIDAMYSDMTLISTKLIDPGSVSDHKWLYAKMEH